MNITEWKRYYPAINEAGDTHANPDGMSDNMARFMDYVMGHGHMGVFNGDTFNCNPYGVEAYIGSPCIEQVISKAHGYPFYLIEGNHDTKKQLTRLFYNHPNFIINRMLVLDDFYGHKLVFRHGHGWSPTWFGLRYFAPSFIEYVCDKFPREWYWLADQFGWMPSHVVASPRYHAEVLSVWNMALRYSKDNDCQTIVAHTHMQGGVVAMFDKRFDYIIADAGVLFDGNFLEITDHIEFRNLNFPEIVGRRIVGGYDAKTKRVLRG